jgi:hypothetical protein
MVMRGRTVLLVGLLGFAAGAIACDAILDVHLKDAAVDATSSSSSGSRTTTTRGSSVSNASSHSMSSASSTLVTSASSTLVTSASSSSEGSLSSNSGSASSASSFCTQVDASADLLAGSCCNGVNQCTGGCCIEAHNSNDQPVVPVAGQCVTGSNGNTCTSLTGGGQHVFWSRACSVPTDCKPEDSTFCCDYGSMVPMVCQSFGACEGTFFCGEAQQECSKQNKKACCPSGDGGFACATVLDGGKCPSE